MLRSLLPLLLLATACTKDNDQDGFPAEIDCNDDDPAVHPGAEEVCDGVDQDCNGTTDDDAIDGLAAWVDGDADGYGDPEQPRVVCALSEGLVQDAADCDDTSAAAHPTAAELANDGVDQDCDGLDLLDGDGDGSPLGEDCDDANPDVFPGQIEMCDGEDEDCSGVPDDNDALGTDAACPAKDCVEIRDAGVLDAWTGVYWIDLDQGQAFRAWCDQDRAGGGWMAMWKNTGGARGATASNQSLLMLETSTLTIVPAEVEPRSGAAAAPVLAYREKAGIELMKVIHLIRPDGAIAAEHEFVLDLGGNSLIGLISPRSTGRTCNTLPGGAISMTVDGKPAGATDRVITDLTVDFRTGQVTALSAGFANARADFPADACGQDDSNRLKVAPDALTRLDGADANATFSSLLVPNMTSAGRDATRCTFGCWDSSSFGGHWDTFTVYVR